MQTIISITSQGQLTIPKAMREALGVGAVGVKAVIRQQGDQLIVTPKTDFWSLAGSLVTKVRLSDEQLQQARLDFSQKWGQQ